MPGRSGSLPAPAREGLVRPASASADPATPITRGGTFHLTNIVVTDLRCNKIKGQMTPEEFVALTAALASFGPTARKDVFARLYAGGRFIRRR